jgi:hypothetical protein
LDGSQAIAGLTESSVNKPTMIERFFTIYIPKIGNDAALQETV